MIVYTGDFSRFYHFSSYTCDRWLIAIDGFQYVSPFSIEQAFALFFIEILLVSTPTVDLSRRIFSKRVRSKREREKLAF